MIRKYKRQLGRFLNKEEQKIPGVGDFPAPGILKFLRKKTGNNPGSY